MRRRVFGWLALLVGGAALGIAALATVAVVVLSAGGVLTTPPGAWVVQLRPLPGINARLSVPGLVRFASSPVALRLLEGRAVDSRLGRLHFARDGNARDGHVQGHDGVNGTGKGDLQRPPHLPAVDAGSHHCAEHTDVEEALAHPGTRLGHDIAALFCTCRSQAQGVVGLLQVSSHPCVPPRQGKPGQENEAQHPDQDDPRERSADSHGLPVTVP